MPTDLLGAVVGLTLTLMILSYMLGDNPLFRIAMYLFVGVAAGYAVVVAVQNVLIPQLVAPVLALGSQTVDPGQITLLGFSWLLALLFLLKLQPANQIGRFPLALLAGVGAAVAVGGAVTGTLLPQAAATAFPIQVADFGALVTGLIVAGGVAATLLTFHYGVRLDARSNTRGPVAQAIQTGIAPVGRVFIGLTFGVMYAGLIAGAAAALAERLGAVRGLLGQ
ncbi:MAG: hypothetical protein JNL73_12175 [Anaerolineales bacterium]|nr:hypothetical protein [Anaerolineales bacterium]